MAAAIEVPPSIPGAAAALHPSRHDPIDSRLRSEGVLADRRRLERTFALSLSSFSLLVLSLLSLFSFSLFALSLFSFSQIVPDLALYSAKGALPSKALP